MTTDLLPLFARTASPFGHLPLHTHTPEETLDQVASRLREQGPDCPWDHHTLREIEAWQARRASGDSSPRPGCWGEYRLTLADGTIVTAIVQWPWGGEDDGCVHLVEFWGDVSPTGYTSHFLHSTEVSGDFGEWLVSHAEAARAQAVREWEHGRQNSSVTRRRKRRTA